MIKAVFFDIDGTLSSFKTHLVPESTLIALHTLKDKGVKIFIATGRSPSELEHFQKTIPINFDGYVAVNGQYCYNREKVIRECVLPTETIANFIKYIDAKKLSCVFVELNYIYLNRVTERVIEMKNMLGNTVPDTPIDTTDRIYQNRVYQIGPYILEEEEKEALKYLPNCRTARWHRMFTDIIPENGGKSEGLRSMLSYYGFDVSESMAFGDGGNDIEMLEFAGTGVAMGNSEQKVKDAADYVTTDVDNDGIYLALKKFGVLN